MNIFIFICLFFFSYFSVISNQDTSFWKKTPKKNILSNGLEFIYQRDVSSPITVFHILIRGGKRNEPEGKAGLAYITARLTLEVPDQKKAREMMNQGSRINTLCMNDYSYIYLACLSENLNDTLKLITISLCNPLFSSLKLNRLKDLKMEKEFLL